jgi:hypothetical protein
VDKFMYKIRIEVPGRKREGEVREMEMGIGYISLYPILISLAF